MIDHTRRARQALGAHNRDALSRTTGLGRARQRHVHNCDARATNLYNDKKKKRKKKKTPRNWGVTVNIPFYIDLFSQVHFIIFAPTFIDNS